MMDDAEWKLTRRPMSPLHEEKLHRARIVMSWSKEAEARWFQFVGQCLVEGLRGCKVMQDDGTVIALDDYEGVRKDKSDDE